MTLKDINRFITVLTLMIVKILLVLRLRAIWNNGERDKKNM